MFEKSFLGHSALGFHSVAYTEWGSETATPTLCVHGLTRNGRDFDRLAEVLCSDRRVFCPDIVGRGKSDWLSDPSLYTYAQYFADMTALIARMGSPSLDWVGTSMGGIMGIYVAADGKTPLRKLVINDVGPFLSLSSLRRIADYVGMTPTFVSMEALERHLRTIYAPFGISGDAAWRSFAAHSFRLLADGKFALAHDPKIVQNFRSLDKDVDFWDVYDRIRCPVLLIRGALSDVLSSEVALEMTRRGPKAQLVEIPSVGHAPALIDAHQTSVIASFLRA